MLDELKEQQRLFQIGLKAGRDFVDGMKSSNVPPLNELQTYMPGATTDFVVGQMFETESKKAYDEIPPEQRLDRSAEKAQAEIIYRESNCSLIQ